MLAVQPPKALVFRWQAWRTKVRLARLDTGPSPLRSELFTVEQLAAHARSIAASHSVTASGRSHSLLARLNDNEQILRAFNRTTLATEPTRQATPAAAWLLDNYYLIEEQIQIARRHLPAGYSRELPRLRNGHNTGLPRVYDIVLELISHVDAQIEVAPLTAFIAAYQTGIRLKLGELWAIPIMLRLGLIENLQRIATRMKAARIDRQLADSWVDRLQEMAEKNPSHLVVVVAQMAQAQVPLSSAFVAEFSQRLSRQNAVLHLARGWLEQRLALHGQSVEHLVALESQNQAADQVSVSHSIASLRFLSAMDAKEFVETLSSVDHVLREDPAGIYSRMDFATRDRYRHAIEAIARLSPMSETAVARQAIALALDCRQRQGAEHRGSHVGFYLIDQGLPALERASHARMAVGALLESGIRRFPMTFYVGGSALLTLGLSAVLMRWSGLPGERNLLLPLILLFMLCSSQLAAALINWLVTLLIRPRLLPRMDYTAGIAPEGRTMVVVPTLITSVDDVDHLIEAIEIHHLSNRDPHLHFALLTDFGDAPAQRMPGDDALLLRTRAGIERLNRQYPLEHQSFFFLFHRPRRWNGSEGVWMGNERKRGKLAEFNALLRDPDAGHFSEIVGETSILPAVRYVITLDTDTQLPRDSARQLVETMTHRLNRPVFDPVRNVVARGYGILQPRVGMSLHGVGRSLFVRLFAGDAGIDPYTRAVSDVYQDLFDEGSFIGKGIYDVDAFERATAGRFPDNAILSHDLLEACFARSGLVSDVSFYENSPSRYNVEVNRRRRWIRGDWQIAPWLFSMTPAGARGRTSNPLSALSQLKLIDNLRRSLVPPALLLLLASWLVLPGFAAGALLATLAIFFLPVLLPWLAQLARKPASLRWTMHLRAAGDSVMRQSGQALLGLAFLPYEALVSLEAVARTLLRMGITHRHLLEWQTSRASEGGAGATLKNFHSSMWAAPAVALASGAALIWLRPSEWGLLLPVLGLWLAAPWLAWWISRPIEPAAPDLTAAQGEFLRGTARRTWQFFARFVCKEENWLPPDNFQESPVPTIASRTSPTNMGLALLANLAAYDLGYLTGGGLLQRTSQTLATMARMDRYRGHFYNWYDTRSLRPLFPLYVSSVDSGNLAGHLTVLGAGLRELADAPVFPAQVFGGLRDTLQILRGLARTSPELARLEAVLAHSPGTLVESWACLRRVGEQIARVADGRSGEEPGTQLREWVDALRLQCQAWQDELQALAPWLALDLFCETGGGQIGRAGFARLENELAALRRAPTLRQLAALEDTLCPAIEEVLSYARTTSGGPVLPYSGELAGILRCARLGANSARARLLDLEQLAGQCLAMAEADDGFLFDARRKLFSIGFNVTELRRDTSFYDLLASEARLGSYVAIAQGRIAQDHWFSMGRLLLPSPQGPILASWSGSMFEYLMPMLVMPSYANTLLDRSCRAAVQQQIEYGAANGVPWGISESGYNLTDVQLNYQYRAFGVPGLGLKRSLADDLVVAPYASAMALMVAPRQACENLQRLAAEGRAGEYGFYEAIDYTPSRMRPGERGTTVLSFMAHHQGMSLLALVSVLKGNPMARRFISSPAMKAADLLLQERVPKAGPDIFSQGRPAEAPDSAPGEAQNAMRVFSHPDSRAPEVHLLSNGRYHVAISSAGGGYSRWGEVALTRWREDPTRDCWGSFIYLREVSTGQFWSAAHQPVGCATGRYEAVFTQPLAEFRQDHAKLRAHTAISVSPEDDIELRRITLTNRAAVTRVIELTTYAEVVLASQAADAAHPAFSNLFVQTEFIPEANAILCTRRPGSPDDTPPWLLHLVVGNHEVLGTVSCETDRSRFIGRGRSAAAPAAMRHAAALSNTAGPVLDPVIALRRTATLAPNQSAVIDVITGVAPNREAALALVDKYQNARMADRALDLAWTHSQVTLRHLNATEGEAKTYGQMAGALIYADAARRAHAGVLRASRRGQSGLWSYGISGDLPIVLLRISDANKIEIVRQLVQAHSYWRMKGLVADLVILNEDSSVYRQSLQERITSLVASAVEAQMLDRPGGIFVRRLEQVPNEDRLLLQSAARIVLDDEAGSLADQIGQPGPPNPQVAAFIPSRNAVPDLAQALPARELIFNNGLGGFTRDGHEYVISLNAGQATPAPWVNVLANPEFGTVVSESGSAYTWAENAHELRLTPWSNDPVQDTLGEALYIRDEQSGQYWSPTPAAGKGASPYVVRHGFGYSVFEHTQCGIACELWIYVAMDAPVKFCVLKLRNLSGRPRRLSVSGYWEWVLGDLRSKSLLHVQTEVDLKTGALLARNNYNADFPDRIAFADVSDAARTLTGDRAEFIGRNGSLAQPAALGRARLSGKVGAGLDPCGALQVACELAEGQEKEVTFRIGLACGLAQVQDLILRFRRADAARVALDGVWAYWNRTLGAINVDTPDPAVNVMANGWLLYQTLSCRLWARTGFYQSGGAYGFRDQLQDVMALVHAEPALTRAHLLRAAAHQFTEGDVQHWWHPPGGRGVRTHFSDDYLWLPHAVCRYVAAVADSGVLAEKVQFLEGRPVKADEEAYYDLPNRAEASATLYEHAVRAIERGLRFGSHGLPLIGCGDWNDGMNRVGNQGRGESVWLAFFLHDVLVRFAPMARAQGDAVFAARCLEQAAQLQASIELHAWDGAWYRRAYFDSGEPLGSHTNLECQIDSLPQSWSVLSGAGNPGRSREAMQSVDRRLVHRDTGLIQLFDPPFDKSTLDPGYIRAYIPGVRENGGQYTHGALWTAMAFARLGQNERAWELFTLLNPVHHGDTAQKIDVYKVEPYVVAADVYAVPPHVGRGGWTWYTGSAGWMYRLLIEDLLGVHLEGEQLRLAPRLPAAWSTFKIHYRYRQTVYHITIKRLAGGAQGGGLVLDGRDLPGALVPLRDDRREHMVELTLAPESGVQH